MKLLHIDSSILGDGSASRRADARDRRAAGARSTRGCQRRPTGISRPRSCRTFRAGRSRRATSARPRAMRRPLAEFLAADVRGDRRAAVQLLIPSQLKAWIDRITVAGKTFRYTASGPQGLAGGKRVIVAVSRGGVYGPRRRASSASRTCGFCSAFSASTRDVRARRRPGAVTGAARRRASTRRWPRSRAALPRRVAA